MKPLPKSPDDLTTQLCHQGVGDRQLLSQYTIGSPGGSRPGGGNGIDEGKQEEADCRTRQRYCWWGLVWFWAVAVHRDWLGCTHSQVLYSQLASTPGSAMAGGSYFQLQLMHQLHSFLAKKGRDTVAHALVISWPDCCTWGCP